MIHQHILQMESPASGGIPAQREGGQTASSSQAAPSLVHQIGARDRPAWWHTRKRASGMTPEADAALRELFDGNGGFAGAKGGRIGRDTLYALMKRSQPDRSKWIPKRAVQQ